MNKMKALLCVAMTGAFASAHALVIDFTDADLWGDGQVASPTDNLFGDLEVTLTSSSDTYSAVERCVDTLGLGLACDNDGIGIRDDEITWTSGNYRNGEHLTVDFSYGVDITEVYLLDLFPNEATGSEVAQMRSENSEGDVSWAVWQADEYQKWGWYIGTEDNDLKGQGGFFSDVVSLTFFSDQAGEYTNISDSDFALAGLKIVSVPEPGTVGLLLMGAAALVGARRRKQKGESLRA